MHLCQKLGELEMDISLAKPSSRNRKNDRRRYPLFAQGGGGSGGGGGVYQNVGR